MNEQYFTELNGYLVKDGKAVHFYDTVASMKSDTKLKSGMYVKTKGYYSANDGGSAEYIVRELAQNETTDNGYTHLLNNGLVAELLINDNQINVKQFGAKGNDTDADDTYFNTAISYARTNNLILYVPIGTYKLENQIDLRSLNLNIEGILDNDESIIIGGDARELGNYDIKIYKTNDITVKGLKNSSVKIIKSDNVVLTADNNVNTDYSIAYNIINIVDCKSITLTGSNSGWINENVFNIKRLRGNLTITGDGSYYHNNNVFEDVCIEGSEKVIQIDYGHNNYITYRGEQNPQVVLPSNNHQTFGNIIQPTYAVSANNFIRSSFFNPSDKYNVTSPKYLPTYQINNLLNLNTSNFLNTNANIFLQEDGKLHGDWAYIFETGDIPLNEVFTILVNCDVSSQRIYVTFKDINGDKIEGDILSSSLNYDTTNKQYKTDNNVAGAIMTFVPSTDVKTVNIQVRTGGNTSFSSLKVELISRFTSLLKVENIRNTQKEMSTTPSLTADSVWSQGDFVKNLAANQNNGTYGWVCVTSGTGSNSVWRKIESTSV